MIFMIFDTWSTNPIVLKFGNWCLCNVIYVLLKFHPNPLSIHCEIYMFSSSPLYDTVIPGVFPKPVPQPGQSRTPVDGSGFWRVGVRVGLENPRETRAIP